MGLKPTTLVALLAYTVGVKAHGHVSNIVINGVYYQNYDPTTFPYLPSQPVVVGWTYSGSDNGFVTPDAFGTSDIICHRSATPGAGHATVAAGDKISIQWTVPWPDSHHGPVIDYLANCNGPCETVDKTTLQFFKIDGAGWVSGGNPGLWATDTLVADNSSWLVQIPSDIAPGNYVLRHEIIALHAAGSTNGAQAYPQCINLQVTGTGTSSPSGTYGTALYKETDPGILFNIYTSPIVYTVPGPTLISGASSSIAQSSSVATTTATATPAGAAAGTTTTTSSVRTTTTSTTSATTVKSTTTLSTSTTKASTSTTTTSAPAGTGTAQTKYGQCGGSGWSGPTSCVAGSTCSALNAYYYQCQ